MKNLLALTSSVCLHTAGGMGLNDSSGQMILCCKVCSSSVLGVFTDLSFHLLCQLSAGLPAAGAGARPSSLAMFLT